MNKRNKVIIIAEAGINHNGDFASAIKLIKKAKKVGADAIKFQFFEADKLCRENTPLARYQKKNKIKNQNELLKKLELTKKEIIRLKQFCKKTKIQFLLSCFDLEGVDFLHKIGVNTIKIPSGEITNFPYLEKISKKSKKIILSTGASTLSEINDAIKILKKGRKKEIIILHCNSAYPTPLEDLNLNCIKLLKDKFNFKIGFSDHSSVSDTSVFAAALGAKIIEKHFTLNKNARGPDHKSSLNPKEFQKMVSQIRKLELSLGKEKKYVTQSEKINKNVIRKSIVAKKIIKKGELFNKDNLTCKRPGIGISPIKWKSIIGKKAKKNFSPDELIYL